MPKYIKHNPALIPDVALIYECMKVETSDMPQWLKGKLLKLGCAIHIDSNQNVIGKKGNTIGAPLLIAHTDTVHRHPPVGLMMINDWIVSIKDGEQEGIGADDRAGCAAILQLIPMLSNCIVLFAAFEESGCRGSRALDIQLINDAGFAIQMDRRIQDEEKSDAIWHTNGTAIASLEFKDHIKPVLDRYSFELNRGVFTDIGELKYRGLDCSALNLSIGYAREHRQSEALHVPSYARTLNLVIDLVKKCRGKQFPFPVKYEPKQAEWGFRSWHDWDKVDTKRYGYGAYSSNAGYTKQHRQQAMHQRLTKAEKKELKELYKQETFLNDTMGESLGGLQDLRTIGIDTCDICGKSANLYRVDTSHTYVCMKCLHSYNWNG